MAGRDFELWQPLLALASWAESDGADGLLDLVREYALGSIETSQDDQTSGIDATLLRALAEELSEGRSPTPGTVLQRVQAAEPGTFGHWSARAVSSHLGCFGLKTRKRHGRRGYPPEAMEMLRRVQLSYGLDLGFVETSPSNVPQRTPTDPHPGFWGPQRG